MNTVLSATLRLLPVFCFCLCLSGCGEPAKTTVVEQPKISAEEQAKADAEYNKSMDN